MGIKYICDVCEKEYTVKGGIGPGGYPTVTEMPPGKWAVITYIAPKSKQEPKPGQAVISSTGEIKGFLVCSQACAEKALDEAKERLRKAFEES
jgi:hypothetical protein